MRRNEAQVGISLDGDWGRSAEEADGFVAALLRIAAAPPLVPSPPERRRAFELAERHGMTAYDAASAAVAQGRALTLVSGDAQLCQAGLARPPAAV